MRRAARSKGGSRVGATRVAWMALVVVFLLAGIAVGYLAGSPFGVEEERTATEWTTVIETQTHTTMMTTRETLTQTFTITRSTTVTQSTDRSTSPGAGMGKEHPGTLAPDFSLIDLDGNAFRLSDFRGRVVVIDFMATWCGPCRQEMPHYGAIWEIYGDRIVLMSIDIDPRETEETLRDFADEFPYATWIWARDTANLGQAYQVAFIPKTVIIDQDGYIRFEHVGVTPASTFIQEINELLG